MNLLGAKLYDPSSAVSKATSALLAMTAFDTTNLRLTVTVPAHGFLQIRMRCNLSGATTMAQVLLGVLEGSTVRGRVVAQGSLPGTAVATTNVSLVADFVIPGLTPGSITLDAAYGVETVVASTNIHYGGPNNTTANDAWGAFVFEIWDPQPLTTGLGGGVNATQISGDTTAADNAEAFFDGTGYAGTNNVMPTTTTVTNRVTANTDQIEGVDATNQIRDAILTDATRFAGANIDAAITSRLAPTTAGRTLDVTATGGAGIDWANVESQATAVNLSATTINLVNTLTTYTGNTPQTGDSFARLGAPAGASVSADIAAIEAQTDDIGVAGAGLTALGDARLANLDAAISTRLATAGYTAPDNASIAAILDDTGTSGVIVATNNDKVGYRLSATGVDDILDEVIEGTVTLRAVLRGYNAALLSKASGLATATAVFRDIDDTKDRITATVDANGNRTVITLDLT